MTLEQDIDTFHDEMLAQLSPEIRDRAVEIFQQRFCECLEDYYYIQELMILYGREWWLRDGFHFGGGMAARNLLRANGVTDDMVPGGNLDNVYVRLLELAVGINTP